MAFDKAVDSAQLDAGLTTIADAIRAKGGTSAPLEFPQGMIDAVTAISGGGVPGDTKMSDFIVSDNKSRVSLKNSEIKKVGSYRFRGANLGSIDLPNAITLSEFSFRENGFTTKETVKLPKVEFINTEAFEYCRTLSSIELPAVLEIGLYAFYGDEKLTTMILSGTNVVKLPDPPNKTFYNTPIFKGQGYVYVPKVLLGQYKAATNWTVIADQIRAIEDYPEITGGAK